MTASHLCPVYADVACSLDAETDVTASVAEDFDDNFFICVSDDDGLAPATGQDETGHVVIPAARHATGVF